MGAVRCGSRLFAQHSGRYVEIGHRQPYFGQADVRTLQPVPWVRLAVGCRQACLERCRCRSCAIDLGVRVETE